jgi:hypothetical protein
MNYWKQKYPNGDKFSSTNEAIVEELSMAKVAQKIKHCTGNPMVKPKQTMDLTCNFV